MFKELNNFMLLNGFYIIYNGNQIIQYYLFNDEIIIRMKVEKYYSNKYYLSFVFKLIYEEIEDNFYEAKEFENDNYNFAFKHIPNSFINQSEIIEFLKEGKLEEIKKVNSVLKLKDFLINNEKRKKLTSTRARLLQSDKDYEFCANPLMIAINIVTEKYEQVKRGYELLKYYNLITLDYLKSLKDKILGKKCKLRDIPAYFYDTLKSEDIDFFIRNLENENLKYQKCIEKLNNNEYCYFQKEIQLQKKNNISKNNKIFKIETQ